MNVFRNNIRESFARPFGPSFLDLHHMPGVYFSPEGEGGGSGEAQENNGGGDGGGQDNRTPAEKLGITPEIQKHFDEIIGQRIGAVKAKAEDDARNKIAEETKKAQQKADLQEQQKQGKWEEVAISRLGEIEAKDKEIGGFKPKAEKWDAFVASETARMDEVAKKFGEGVKTFDPGSDPARFEERVAKFPQLIALQEKLYPSANYDNDMGKGNGGSGRGANQFDRIRNEEKAAQEKNANQNKTLDQRLGMVNIAS